MITSRRVTIWWGAPKSLIKHGASPTLYEDLPPCWWGGGQEVLRGSVKFQKKRIFSIPKIFFTSLKRIAPKLKKISWIHYASILHAFSQREGCSHLNCFRTNYNPLRKERGGGCTWACTPQPAARPCSLGVYGPGPWC